MALINCRECGSSISDVADKCPRCGSPTAIAIRQKKKKNILFGIVGGIFGGIVGIILVFVFIFFIRT
jgi:hypothetical protein